MAVTSLPSDLRAAATFDREAVARLHAAVASVVRGKPDAIRAALIALLARGHLLIEDIPGVGKTTLARSLAAAVGDSPIRRSSAVHSWRRSPICA